ncbi:hypothetical protein Ddye_015955 [Dipteronia dyeriana]|uniref:Uncharacterized protein n=1 Tax=Dipteronia dyeriana TaxID=168575 RepID=A0AAD9WZ04_9ROSI|nr:hypothetical protein Ddye_015955 [Dipteronia dyeriana]
MTGLNGPVKIRQLKNFSSKSNNFFFLDLLSIKQSLLATTNPPTNSSTFVRPKSTFIRQFLNFPQLPTPPPSVDPPAKGRYFSPDETVASLSPPPPPPYVGFGYEDEFYQVVPNIEAENMEDLVLKEQIFNLESFLELEQMAATAIEAVTTQVSGSSADDDGV